MRFIAILGYLFFTYSLIQAQDQDQGQWQDDGEIEDAQVIIEKDRKIELPQINRNFERIPPLPVQGAGMDNLNYEFQNYQLKLQGEAPDIRVFTIKEDPLPKFYGNYIKAGLGNYITPYLEIYTYNKRSDEYLLGAHFNHLSSILGPVDGRNSGTSQTSISADGKYFTKPLVLSGDITYNRDKYYFYGYQPGSETDRDTLRQVFNSINISAGLEDNLEDADISYSLNTGFNYIRDRFQAQEFAFSTDLALDYYLSDELSAQLQSDLLLTRRKDLGTINRSLFRVRPGFTYQLDQLKIQAGFNVVYQNDTLSNLSKMNFYPFARAELNFTEGISVYGGIDGNMLANTFSGMVDENPWLTPNVPIFNTNKNFEFYGGLKGNVIQNLSFNTGFSLANYKNMYFFVNNLTDTTEFSIIYDQGNTQVFNFFAEASLVKSEIFRLTLKGDLFGYNTDEVQDAWHKPRYKFSASAFYNLYEKILLSTNMYFLGGIKAYMTHSDQISELDNIADINFKIDYLFSDRFSVFLSFNNIIGNNYQRYLNYPSRGILVMGGVSYSF
ncbi:MAG: hypothetical protein ACNS62_03755 [Candidatus Cyclobacteriaceae bacterium M3_2C_046]